MRAYMHACMLSYEIAKTLSQGTLSAFHACIPSMYSHRSPFYAAETAAAEQAAAEKASAAMTAAAKTAADQIAGLSPVPLFSIHFEQTRLLPPSLPPSTHCVWQTRAHTHKHKHTQRRKQRRRRLLLKEKELLVSSLSLLPHPPFSAPLPPSLHPSIPPSLLSLSSTYRHAPCPLNRSLLSIYTPRAHTHTNTELKHSGQGSSREEGWR